MNRESLKKLLDTAGINPNAYRIDGRDGEEQFCMQEMPPGWVVYYAERGMRRDERMFASKSAACAYLLDLLLADPTSRYEPKKP